MSTDLAAIVDAIAEVQSGIVGIRKAWPRLPDSLTDLPCFVNEPTKGDETDPPRPNRRHLTHDVRMVLAVADSEAPSASNQAWPFVPQVWGAFEASTTLGGLVAGCHVLDYQTGRVEYGGATYYAVTFTLRVIVSDAVIRQP